MRSLESDRLPDALSREKPATNLASLVMGAPLLTLIDVVVSQWERSDRFLPLVRYGIGPLNRALFFGPPGNGKTIAAQLIASRLDCPLYRVCCDALLGKYLGETCKAVAEIMDWLSDQSTCVVLFDEVEAIFPGRERADGSSASQEIVGAMTVFWQRLDRWTTPQLFLLATNLPDRLDAALRSRIELQVEFGPPTREQSLQLLEYWAETLHEYGSDEWAPRLKTAIATSGSGGVNKSFRALWQAIASETRAHVLRV